MRDLVDRLLEQPLVYAAWQAPFAAGKFAPVERALGSQVVHRVLDVGCGPGTNVARFADADYVGVDINPRYLARARARYRGRFVQADVATAPLTSLGTFDAILVNSVLHHLPDDAVARVLRHLRELLAPEARVHVLELVMPDTPCIARLMAKLDRGRHARRLDAWRAMLTAHFELVSIEPYDLGGGLWAMVYFQGKARSCASR